MIANYHTHTWRCNHAQGTEEEYVLSALQYGLEILGFADHSPYFFPGDYYSTFRMKPEQLKDYCGNVFALREKYGHRIQLPLGVEVEYYPELFAQLLPFLKDHGVEYLLLGQHLLGNELGEVYTGAPTTDVDKLKRYCAQTRDAMQTGLFAYFAHPDLIRFCGEDKIYREHMRGLCRDAKTCGMVLEINLLGIREGRNYPDNRFWEIAAEEGNQVILGCDAHRSWHISDAETEARGRELAQRYGLTLLDTLPLRRI